MCMRNRTLAFVLLAAGLSLLLGLLLNSPFLKTVLALALLAAGLIILNR